jgi:N-acetylglutamate synthase-like GNAT family acetyltransferase
MSPPKEAAQRTVTIWHLELAGPQAFTPSRQERRFRLERVKVDAPAFLRWLYVATGAPWHWVDRLGWGEARWRERWRDTAVEFWVAHRDGAPLGYFELARVDGGTVEIAYFGLLPYAIGTGQGGALLTAAVERAWDMGAARIYVNTCSLDHAHALDNYRRRGFRVFREDQVVREVPATAGGET